VAILVRPLCWLNNITIHLAKAVRLSGCRGDAYRASVAATQREIVANWARERSIFIIEHTLVSADVQFRTWDC